MMYTAEEWNIATNDAKSALDTLRDIAEDFRDHWDATVDEIDSLTSNLEEL